MKRPLAVTAMFLVSFLAECDSSAGPADGSRSLFPEHFLRVRYIDAKGSGTSATIIAPGSGSRTAPRPHRWRFRSSRRPWKRAATTRIPTAANRRWSGPV